MRLNATKNMKKKVSNKKNEYYCSLCDYKCFKKFLYTQHLKTKKHIFHINATKCSKNMLNFAKSVSKNKIIDKLIDEKCIEKKVAYNICKKNVNNSCSCGKNYKHVQSYYRHIKNCEIYKIINKTDDNKINIQQANEDIKLNTTPDVNAFTDNNNIIKNLLDNLIIQNNNIISENKEMRDIIKTIIPKIENKTTIKNKTTINNQFNINMFLNETCKDAINLSDFVNTLNLELNDLYITKKSGYINGIANIFIKNLEQLDLHKRPIHCSNYKDEILYVKDNNIWEIDNTEKTKLKQAINNVSKKQYDIIKQWEIDNPDWNNNDKKRSHYCELVNTVTSTNIDNNNNKNNDKIIKIIAKEVIIDK